MGEGSSETREGIGSRVKELAMMRIVQCERHCGLTQCILESRVEEDSIL